MKTDTPRLTPSHLVTPSDKKSWEVTPPQVLRRPSEERLLRTTVRTYVTCGKRPPITVILSCLEVAGPLQAALPKKEN